MYVKIPIVLLALIEGSLLIFAPYLAVGIGRAGIDVSGATPSGHLLPTALVFAASGLVSLFAVGLYSTRQRSSRAGVFFRTVASMFVAAAISAFCYYVFPGMQLDHHLLAVTTFIAIVASFVARLLFERIVDEELFKRRVLVFGAGKRAQSLLDLRRRADTRSFRIIGFVSTAGDVVSAPADRVVERPPDLFRWAVENDLDEIVIAMDDRRRGFPIHELLECRLAGIDILELPTFLERETGKVRLDILNPSWIIFGDGFRASPVQRVLERAFDLVASFCMLLLALPFVALAVIGIKFEEGLGAQVLYRQRRVGRHGEIFDVLKFRSMRIDAEQGGAQYATKNDPRVTRMGGFMRKSRIDELPQLLNVLRGEMSFVGPRPERPEFVCQLEERIPYYRERHTVKPGITGWAQLCYPYGSTEKDAVEKLQYDLYYVKNRSLLFDLAILMQTVEVVLWGKGAR